MNNISRLFCLATAVLSTTLSQANTITASWTATNTLHTGLYAGNGVQTSSTVNLEGISSYETYDVAQSWPYTTYQPYSTLWKTVLKFHFSSSAWQAVSGLTTIGVQLCHYVVTTSNGSVSISLPVDYLQEPTAGLVSYSVSGFSFVTNYSQVNPKPFTISQMTVDPTDPTGKTGYISWDSKVSDPAPWDDFPSGTTVGGIDPSSTFRGMLWVFPRPGYAGDRYYFPPFAGWPTYPVPVIGP